MLRLNLHAFEPVGLYLALYFQISVRRDVRWSGLSVIGLSSVLQPFPNILRGYRNMLIILYKIGGPPTSMALLLRWYLSLDVDRSKFIIDSASHHPYPSILYSSHTPSLHSDLVGFGKPQTYPCHATVHLFCTLCDARFFSWRQGFGGKVINAMAEAAFYHFHHSLDSISAQKKSLEGWYYRNTCEELLVVYTSFELLLLGGGESSRISLGARTGLAGWSGIILTVDSWF